jgi:hypothetical protein
MGLVLDHMLMALRARVIHWKAAEAPL